MKCQILFSRKSKKNITSLSSAESVHSGKHKLICMFLYDGSLIELGSFCIFCIFIPFARD